MLLRRCVFAGNTFELQCEKTLLCHMRKANAWIRVASGPRVKLTGWKSALNPSGFYSTDRSKAVVLVLFLLFVALCSFVVPALLSVFFFFFYMCCDASIVVTIFNSCPLLVVMWSPSTAAHFAFCFASCD